MMRVVIIEGVDAENGRIYTQALQTQFNHGGNRTGYSFVDADGRNRAGLRADNLAEVDFYFKMIKKLKISFHILPLFSCVRPTSS